MTMLEIMQGNQGYVSDNRDMPGDLSARAKTLCWQYNQTAPNQEEERARILQDLLGTCHPLTFCVILDTSPVRIGANAFIAPGVCIACSGHSLDARQRGAGIGTSKPITIGEDVWIGANCTICGGVTIGDGSVIGAGSVVTRDIPAGVVAVGNPCRVLRKITPEDRLAPVCLPEEETE